jgi:hypothetical protein
VLKLGLEIWERFFTNGSREVQRGGSAVGDWWQIGGEARPQTGDVRGEEVKHGGGEVRWRRQGRSPVRKERSRERSPVGKKSCAPANEQPVTH